MSLESVVYRVLPHTASILWGEKKNMLWSHVYISGTCLFMFILNKLFLRMQIWLRMEFSRVLVSSITSEICV